MPNGRIWDQGVDYEIKPVLCKFCKGLGHEECKVEDPSTKMPSRGRSRSRARRNLQKEKQKGEDGGPSAPKATTHILSAFPSDKGKGKLHEVGESSLGKVDTLKDWQLVVYKNSNLASSSSLASGGANFVHANESSAKDVMDELLPTSPNIFGALFDEDERAHLEKKCGEAEESKKVDGLALKGKGVKSTRFQLGSGVKMEELRRSGRRRSANSLSS